MGRSIRLLANLKIFDKFRDFKYLGKIISLFFLIYPLVYLFGFNYPLIIFLFILPIYIFVRKDHNLFRNTAITSDLLLSLFLLCTLGKDANSLSQIRTKLFGASVLIPSISLYLSFEYILLLKKCKYKFKSFIKAITALPLIAILLAVLYSIRSVIEGDSLLDYLHYFLVISLILIQIPLYGFFKKENIDNKFKTIPIILFLILILFCKSKASILITLCILLFTLDELLIFVLFKKFRFKEKFLNVVSKSIAYLRGILSMIFLFFVILIIIFADNPFIFTDNPYVVNISPKLINSFSSNRIMLNNSYAEYCIKSNVGEIELESIPIGFNRFSESNILIHREVQLSKLDDIRFNEKLRKFSENNIISEKEMNKFKYHYPHDSIINYFCIHKIFWPRFFIFFLISFTFYSLIRFGFTNSLLFIISYSMLFFEYIPYLPALFMIISSFSSLNSIINFKYSKEIL